MMKRGGVDLVSFIGGLVRGVTKAQQSLVVARTEQLERHFDKNEEGVFVAKTLQFDMGENQILNVPQYVLSRVNQIGIDSAIIRGSVRIVNMEELEIDCDVTDHDSQIKYYVKPSSPDNKSFEIELKFSKKVDCEAENRLTESLLALVETQVKE